MLSCSSQWTAYNFGIYLLLLPSEISVTAANEILFGCEILHCLLSEPPDYELEWCNRPNEIEEIKNNKGSTIDKLTPIDYFHFW